MKTKGDARAYYLRALDEATKKGVEVAPSKNADYNDKFDYFLDEAQKYVAGIIKIPEVFQVTQNPLTNLLGLLRGFELIQILPDKPKTYELIGCKSAYFEMDNLGTCTIKVNGNPVQTVNNTVKGTFTAYQVLTGANDADSVTFEFTSTYPYNIRNTGFYGYEFELTTDIPVYTPYVVYDMPSDFLAFDSVIIKSDPRVYASYVAHKWENNKKVVLNYYDKGSFDIHYFKYPADISPSAEDTTALEIEDKGFEAVALQCAVLATAADNPGLSSWLRSIATEKIQNVLEVEQPIFNAVQTVFSAY